MISDSDQPALGIATARADEIRAEVLLRVAAAGLEERPRLEGTLTGPLRGRDTTLPTSVPLEAGAMPGGWSRATFTEPAYWTPELPNLYRLQARSLVEGRPSVRYDRMIGLRRVGVRGRSCWLDGRRWVPRGVSVGPLFEREGSAGCGARQPAADPVCRGRLEPLRGIHAAAEMRDPTVDVLAAADAAGVAIVARLEHAGGRPFDEVDALGRIAAWSLHPSAMIVVVPRTMPVAVAAATLERARCVKDTMLLAVEVDGTRPPAAVAEGLAAAAAVLVVDLPGEVMPHEGWGEWPVRKPLLARCREPGPAGGPPSAAERWASLRSRCDRLQASLAAWGIAGGNGPARDWAGYLVASW